MVDTGDSVEAFPPVLFHRRARRPGFLGQRPLARDRHRGSGTGCSAARRVRKRLHASSTAPQRQLAGGRAEPRGHPARCQCGMEAGSLCCTGLHRRLHRRRRRLACRARLQRGAARRVVCRRDAAAARGGLPPISTRSTAWSSCSPRATSTSCSTSTRTCSTSATRARASPTGPPSPAASTVWHVPASRSTTSRRLGQPGADLEPRLWSAERPTCRTITAPPGPRWPRAGARRIYLLGYDLFNEPWPGSRWPGLRRAAGLLALRKRQAAGHVRACPRRHPQRRRRQHRVDGAADPVRLRRRLPSRRAPGGRPPARPVLARLLSAGDAVAGHRAEEAAGLRRAGAACLPATPAPPASASARPR